MRKLPWPALARIKLPTHNTTPKPDPAPPRQKLTGRAHRHLITTPSGVWAYFLIDGVDWPMQTGQVRDTIRADQQHRWADLTGHQVKLWGLSVPYPHRDFARRLYNITPNPLVTPAGTVDFAGMVDSAQEAMLALAAKRAATVLAVRVTTDPVRVEDLPLLLGTFLPPEKQALDKPRRDMRRVTEAVARAGWRGRPMSPHAMRWLMHAMIGIGSPTPAALRGPGDDTWDEDDLPGFTDPVIATANPYALTTQLRVRRGSTVHDHHVAVLHVEDIGPRDTDRADLDPWLAWPATLEYPVTVCATLDVVDGRDLRGVAQLDRRRAENVAKHHAEHGDRPPAQVERGIEQAVVVEDEVTNGTREVAARLVGTVTLAVTGPTEEDTLRTASDLTVAAAREQSMTLVHDYGQYGLYRSYIPGEVTPRTGHVQQFGAEFAAGGVPNATSTAGDATGFLVGNIAGSSDVYVFDPSGGTRSDRSNVIAVGAKPGRGKSTLAGALAHFAVMRGEPAIVFDPSGPLARLTKVPSLVGNARHMSLADAAPGVLMPGFMVPTPERRDHDTDDAWRNAVERARTERIGLTGDVLLGLLPHRMVVADQTGEVEGYIRDAAAEAGGEYGADPWDAVDWLATQTGSPVALRLHHLLRTASGSTAGHLIFPPRGRGTVSDDATEAVTGNALLTVITMERLVLPSQGVDPATWSSEARMSLPVLELGARLASRTIYANKRPKTVILDELGISTGGAGSFHAFAMRSAFDSRKFAATIGLLFQNPATLHGLGENVTNLIGAAFVGQMDHDAAVASLPILGLRDDSGYEQVITGLDKGEFVARGWDGRCRKVLVDRSWWDQHLVDALDTTPITGADSTLIQAADVFADQS